MNNIVSEYVSDVMKVDRGVGNELLYLNFKNIAKEMNIPANVQDAKKNKYAKKREHRKNR